MGHAYLANICNFFITRLYAKGKLSTTECIEGLQKKGETLHAAEGEYEDDYMLAMGLWDVISFLTGRLQTLPGQGEQLSLAASRIETHQNVVTDLLMGCLDQGVLHVRWECWHVLLLLLRAVYFTGRVLRNQPVCDRSLQKPRKH